MRRLVLACFAMFSSPVLAEDLVVLRSSLASIRVGQIVDGGAVLALPAGGQVTLMTAQGKAVSLNGPYQGIPSPQVAGNGDRNLLSALSGLASRGGVETSALGAYRNPPLGAPTRHVYPRRGTSIRSTMTPNVPYLAKPTFLESSSCPRAAPRPLLSIADKP